MVFGRLPSLGSFFRSYAPHARGGLMREGNALWPCARGARRAGVRVSPFVMLWVLPPPPPTHRGDNQTNNMRSSHRGGVYNVQSPAGGPGKTRSIRTPHNPQITKGARCTIHQNEKENPAHSPLPGDEHEIYYIAHFSHDQRMCIHPLGLRSAPLRLGVRRQAQPSIGQAPRRRRPPLRHQGLVHGARVGGMVGARPGNLS